ncbi:hypothetical protein [Microvirga tunisiensis]|uniref:hypothetical protein n=1 Tax=Microvirga tunisiensis TaxID=2108360 RepID=UPI001865782E|nr:hypothetical protein [Microvirga tunisiensis]
MSTTTSTARVIEIGSVTAGVAVPEESGFRFFSSQHPFDSLEGRRFRNLKQVIAAAHDQWRRTTPPPRSKSSRTTPKESSTDLLLALPGPFLLAV